jgi:hypothetical protein
MIDTIDTTDWRDQILDGETLLWVGRPDPGFHIRWRYLALSAVGAVVCVLAVILLGQAWGGAVIAAPGAVYLLALAFGLLLFGLWLLLGMHVVDMLRRRQMIYALTDQRALIQARFMGLGTAAFPITADSPIWLAQTAPPSVYFAHIRRKVRKMERIRRTMYQTATIDVGFEFIPDAAAIYQQICDIQQRQT